MGMQMYIVAQRGEVNDDTSRQVQHCIRDHGGLILMVTRTGPLVALEDSQVASVGKHPLISFMGPVTLNPHGFAAARLQAIFAANLSKQLQLPGQPGEPAAELEEV